MKNIGKRRMVQLSAFIVAVLLTINHAFIQSGGGISWLSSGYIHYVCPICGVTTIYQYFASSASWLTKLQNPVTIVLGIATVTAIIFGPMFCGWLCPFGAFQDFMSKVVGKKIKKREYIINKNIDMALRWVRYFALLLVIYMTANSAVAILESVNPYHALLNLFVGEIATVGFILLLVIAVLAVFVERPWCKYLCPYGALLGLFNILRIKAIVRNPSTCIGCKKCDKVCPMNIEVSKSGVVRNHQCISCLQCTSENECPVENTVLLTGAQDAEEKIEVNFINTSAAALVLVSLALITFNIDRVNASDVSYAASDIEITSELTGEYQSGIYTGEGTGFNTGLEVEITVDNNQITGIEITDHNETVGYYEEAFTVIPASIIADQLTDVDVVTGATKSSEGIIEAVNDALLKATISNSTENKTEEVVLEDTQEQVAEEPVGQVLEEPEEQAIEEPVEQAGEEPAEQAVEEPEEQAVEEPAEQAVEETEKQAVEESEEEIVEETVTSLYAYADGSYTGSAKGYDGTLSVEVVVEDSMIKSIEVTDNNETPLFLERALSVIDDIITTQSTEVDVVSGATFSSEAIIYGTEDALNSAK